MHQQPLLNCSFICAIYQIVALTFLPWLLDMNIKFKFTYRVIYIYKFVYIFVYRIIYTGFPGGSVVKNLPANAGAAGDECLIPGLERCPGGGNDNLLQYSFWGNPSDRGAWQVIVHRVQKSQTRLSMRVCTWDNFSGLKTVFFYVLISYVVYDTW